jgi:predicted nucleic acid-binding protein
LENSNNGVLIDTSVWIEFFKKTSLAGDAVVELLNKGLVWVSGIELCELVQGAKSEAEKTRIISQLTNLHYVEMSVGLWQRAGEVAMSLKRKGLSLPVSDILLAAVAIEHNLSVFTLDKHFESIPGIRLYKL